MSDATSADRGEQLWAPSSDALESTQLGAFLRRVADRHDLDLGGYTDLWQWSVDHLQDFWSEVADFAQIRFHDAPNEVLADASMPGAEWFPGATLNYAEHLLTRDDDHTALVARSQTRAPEQVTYAELRDRVARFADGLRDLGVERGDRVAAYLPNVPEAIVAFLATASIGAVWSSCAPEFGTQAVVDRLTQIAPKVLITIDGYRYGSKEIDRATEVADIRAALPALEATVLLPYLSANPEDERFPGVVRWDDVGVEGAELSFAPVPFDHPLYVLFSSGTTGIPKAIVHGHGGITLEHAKMTLLHHDMRPDDHFFWFTTTGWMMWNYLVSGLLTDSTVVLFDGDPGYPDLDALWQLAEDVGITILGVSAPFVMNCRKAGLSPGDDHDLHRLRQIGSTGAPLPPEGFHWIHDEVGEEILTASVSGGTDVCTAFVGAAPLVPVWAGEISCRCLGAKVEAYDRDGETVIGQRGELVITAPMPSMPVGFWGDDDGSRYRSAYFEHFPGVWRHGDWIRITERGSCIITGRSDATLNRGGVRMGTSEFYRIVEDFPEVRDSLVIHLEDQGGEAGRLLLFVAPAPGHTVDDDLRSRLTRRIREQLSPRHVPDEIHAVGDVPRTLSGKKLEVPVKALFAGAALEDVASEGALANPESLDDFRALVDHNS